MEVKLDIVILHWKNINTAQTSSKTFIDVHTINILFTNITNELLIILIIKI